MKELKLTDNVSIEDVISFIGAEDISIETGEYGMILLYRLLSYNRVGTTLEMSSNNEAITYQFIKYDINGTRLTVKHNEQLDDRKANWEIDPETFYPITSMTLYKH